MWVISWLAANLLASQEGLCCAEAVTIKNCLDVTKELQCSAPPAQNFKNDSERATVRLEPNTPCRSQHNNGGRRTPKKNRQTFPATTGTQKPISHQLSGCQKPETAQANLAM